MSEQTQKKVVVFGGSGFLGSHVADALTAKGYNVVIFDRATSPYLMPEQQMIVGDILDREAVREAVRGAAYVYHFAGIADIAEAKNKPLETVQFNVMGTMYILEACREFGVQRFMYASTVYVYSELGSFYRSSKQACELFIENYQKAYGLEFTILRYGSLYGRRANHFNFIHNSIRQALTQGKIERKGDGNEVRDYINVLDAARASVEVLTDEEFRNSYLMMTGTQTTRVREILEMIREMMHNNVELRFLDETFDEHYEITPFSFKPQVAKKYVSRYYHDLGQGLLDCIYEVYEQLVEDKTAMVTSVSRPSGE